MSNGSLARSRIINARRSDDASLLIRLRFGIDNSSSEQIQLFHKALEKFICDRPQEFHSTFAFRLSAVEADLGFVQYMVTVQCHSSWQNIRSVLDTRGKVLGFCLELQKKLKLRYLAPPMPIHLNIDNSVRAGRGLPPGLGMSTIDPFQNSASAFNASTRLDAIERRQKRDSDLAFSVTSDQVGHDKGVDYVNTAEDSKKDR